MKSKLYIFAILITLSFSMSSCVLFLFGDIGESKMNLAEAHIALEKGMDIETFKNYVNDLGDDMVEYDIPKKKANGKKNLSAFVCLRLKDHLAIPYIFIFENQKLVYWAFAYEFQNKDDKYYNDIAKYLLDEYYQEVEYRVED